MVLNETKISDSLLDYLGEEFVKKNLHSRTGLTFESFVILYQSGMILEA